MNELIYLLDKEPIVSVILVTLIGLLLGSFLNVVIYRLPLMMHREFMEQCPSPGLPSNSQTEQNSKQFNLAWPGSHCPACQAPVKAWQNIPVISYLVLKGRCNNCKSTISFQYPLVEITSGFFAVISWQLFGLSPEGIAFFIVSLLLLALSIIDLKTFLLPDRLTLPLLWGGLLYQSIYQPPFLNEALWGAALGYLILWSIYWLFKLITGKEGMGYGDFKLLSALGAWLGASFLPALLIISALTGLIIGLAYKTKNRGHQGGVPFGPALAFSGWLCLAFPDTVRAIMAKLFL
ncbi:prepilin peptidase [Oceanospirillum linum]|nr:A24 family peptidase [Oceanospirillum linum]SEF55415.1 type 4 prepilin peptidase 1 Aspartic peptidase. MEROPS family A24A [Oleiphilus messinensis]SMP05241.1 leader peptidase (prepilin peptidase) / N-methyltransferase [Oceanospirillum linum]